MTTTSHDEALAEAKRSLARPLSADESIEFARGAIEILEDPDHVRQFEQDIEEVSVAAIEIDNSFDRVGRSFQDMVNKHGHDFPELAGFKREWDGYKDRWVTYLWSSRDVASEMSAVLQRYDQVFLQMIESIKTDQDRQDVIQELLSFSNESHQAAAQMSINFKNLSADVRGFGSRYATYLEQKSVELDREAKLLQADITLLQEQIQSWTEAIIAGLLAMGAGLVISFWTLIVTGTAVAYMIAKRIQAERELQSKQVQLAQVNLRQQALAELKTEFDILKPDIALIADRLIVFGNIWQTVSTESRAFGAHLEKGMQALDDEEFRLQVTLARKSCTPLRLGLARYATALSRSSLSISK